jgi:hypothetical protein
VVGSIILLRRGEAADLGVLLDDRLVLREVDAERLVARDVAFQPLDVGPELPQHLVRLRRSALELLPLERAHLRNIALDDELAQSHVSLPGISVAILGVALG